jgi:hypothetical protein
MHAPALAKECMRGPPHRNTLGPPPPEPAMETRLIIAYSLIAIMVALAIFGVVKFMQKQAKSDRRNAGKGDHMRDGSDL